MSRSYKKTPGFCDRNPFMKNYANRRIRRKPIDHEITNGGSYKRMMCSYDICDYKCVYFTEADHRKYAEWRSNLGLNDDKAWYRCYYQAKIK